MVLFDLNNVRGAAAVPGHAGHASAFQSDVLAPVKTVKRLSTHPWPFPVKNVSMHRPAEPAPPARLASSFET